MTSVDDRGQIPTQTAEGRAGPANLWPIALAFAAIVSSVVLANSPGSWIGDNRWEQYDNPARRVARLLSLWDGSRGLGRIREDLWPGVTLPLALLRGLGASNALAEHLWHATLVVTGGVGMVAVVRLFRPRIGAEHVLAGLLYMLGPYSAVFLTPSNLYLHYAIAPWFVVCAYRGVHDAHRWRWAARVALGVFLVGNNDPPGLIYAGLTLVPTLGFALVVARTTTPRIVLAWLARTAVLCVAANAAALYKVWAAAATYAQRLDATESPEVISQASSWAESFRGLGNWLTYFPSSLGLIKPQAEPFLTNGWLAAASFVAPLVAVGTVCASRWRPRLLFGTMMLTSLVVMVGAHPLDDPSPYGRLLLDAYERSSLLDVLRNSYKAGSGLMIGTAALFGVGSVEGLAWLRRRHRRGHALAVASVVLVLAATAFPFCSLRLYKPEWQVDDVPGYVEEAMAWMDGQGGGGRVLVLPGSWRNGFRWGWVNDDVLDAMLRRPHVIDTAIPLSNPLAADLLAAVDAHLDDRHYVSGTVAPLARRLGVDHVMIRNDVAWQSAGLARPAEYSRLRAEPDLELVATFGRPGQFTTAASDRSDVAAQERRLPPIEIYRIDGGGAVVRAEPPTPGLLVSGAGGAFPALAAEGLLDGAGPVRYTARTGAARTTELLEAGAGVVITDTNRRRLEIVTDQTEASETLAAGQDLRRPTRELFGVAGAETVATFGDGARITAEGRFNPVGGLTPWYRPAKAFDGDPRTAWLTGAGQDPTGDLLRVDFAEPTRLDAVTLDAATPADAGSAVTDVGLVFSDGSRVPVALARGRASMTFPPRRADWVEVVIEGRAGRDGPPVGFSEITFPGVDLVEVVQAPDDLFRMASGDGELARALAEAPTRYLFSRVEGQGLVDEELALRRRFHAAGERRYDVSGSLALGAGTPDRVVDALAGTAVGAWGSSRVGAALGGWGGAAVDDDPTTRWTGRAAAGERLTVRFPRRAPRSVEVVVGTGDDLATIEAVRVSADGVAVDAPVRGGLATVVLPGASVRELVVEVTEVRTTDAGRPMAIEGISLDGRPLRAEDPFGEVACTAGLLHIDGDDLALRLVDPSAEAILRGEPVRFEGCREAELDDGWHELAVVSVLADRIVLASPGTFTATTPAPPVEPRIEVLDEAPERLHLRVDAPDGALLVNGQSWDEGWTATVDGAGRGGAEPVDTLNGWVLEAGTGMDVVLSYRPQRLFEATLLVSLVATACCAWIGRPERRR